MKSRPATAAPATATLLLPASDRCLQSPSRVLVAALARADRLADAATGRASQLQRHFDIVPRTWPVAALTRQFDCGDAAGSAWLRADPAWVRPDINGARMFDCGESLHPDQDDVDALLPALRPLFGDAGFALDAPTPLRWYLRLAQGSPVPSFAEPDEVVGTDLFEHLPGSGEMDEAATRRWRALMSDVQVVLHNHPWNGRRVAAGKPPINSLWFWGGGVLPDALSSAHTVALSDDSLLRALATAARIEISSLPEKLTTADGNMLLDLRSNDIASLQDQWLEPVVEAMHRRRLAGVLLDCADGIRLRLAPAQRWRFWRKPRSFLRRAEQGT
jgi:hypothetical protein